MFKWNVCICEGLKRQEMKLISPNADISLFHIKVQILLEYCCVQYIGVHAMGRPENKAHNVILQCNLLMWKPNTSDISIGNMLFPPVCYTAEFDVYVAIL